MRVYIKALHCETGSERGMRLIVGNELLGSRIRAPLPATRRLRLWHNVNVLGDRMFCRSRSSDIRGRNEGSQNRRVPTSASALALLSRLLLTDRPMLLNCQLCDFGFPPERVRRPFGQDSRCRRTLLQSPLFGHLARLPLCMG